MWAACLNDRTSIINQFAAWLMAFFMMVVLASCAEEVAQDDLWAVPGDAEFSILQQFLERWFESRRFGSDTTVILVSVVLVRNEYENDLVPCEVEVYGDWSDYEGNIPEDHAAYKFEVLNWGMLDGAKHAVVVVSGRHGTEVFVPSFEGDQDQIRILDMNQLRGIMY